MAWSPLRGVYGDTPVTSFPAEQKERIKKVLLEIGQEVGGTDDQVALAFILRHPSKPHIVLGTSRPERFELAEKALSIHLSREQWYRIWRASEGREVP